MMITATRTAALAIAATGLVATATPAVAMPIHASDASAQTAVWDAGSYEHGRKDKRYQRRGYYNSRYDTYGRQPYYGDRVNANTRVWRGDNGRYYCKKDNGTTGLLIGGAVGGLLGHEVAGRGGDRTLGVILGAAGGALLGREIDKRSGGNQYCR